MGISRALSWRALGGAAMALASAGCGDEAASTQGTGAGSSAGGNGTGGAGVGASGSGGSTSNLISGVGGGLGQGGTPPTFDCDPAAEPGSLYELTANSLDINVLAPVSMCEYRDDVLLIFNAAAV